MVMSDIVRIVQLCIVRRRCPCLRGVDSIPDRVPIPTWKQSRRNPLACGPFLTCDAQFLPIYIKTLISVTKLKISCVRTVELYSRTSG